MRSLASDFRNELVQTLDDVEQRIDEMIEALTGEDSAATAALEKFPSAERVLSTPEGTTIRSNNLRRREWAKAVKLAALDPKPTFHDMRHTAVSLWIVAGTSDMQITTWAGHTSPQFTKSRYGHLFPEAGREVADRLDKLMASATANPSAEVVAMRKRGEA